MMKDAWTWQHFNKRIDCLTKKKEKKKKETSVADAFINLWCVDFFLLKIIILVNILFYSTIQPNCFEGGWGDGLRKTAIDR